MTQYIQYEVADGSKVLVEIEDKGGRVTSVSRDGKIEPISSARKFEEALASIRGSVKALINEIDSLQVEEAEVKFGLKSIGELGIGNGLFAIGKVGGEINYEITLKWKKPKSKLNE